MCVCVCVSFSHPGHSFSKVRSCVQLDLNFVLKTFCPLSRALHQFSLCVFSHVRVCVCKRETFLKMSLVFEVVFMMVKHT